MAKVQFYTLYELAEMVEDYLLYPCDTKQVQVEHGLDFEPEAAYADKQRRMWIKVRDFDLYYEAGK